MTTSSAKRAWSHLMKFGGMLSILNFFLSPIHLILPLDHMVLSH